MSLLQKHFQIAYVSGLYSEVHFCASNESFKSVKPINNWSGMDQLTVLMRHLLLDDYKLISYQNNTFGETT